MSGRRRKVVEGVVEGDVHAVLGDLVPAEEESQGDEQTTCRDERDHVGHPGHEGLLDALAPTDLGTGLLGLLVFAVARRNTVRVRILGCRESLGDHLLGLVDGTLHP